jgi:hypothetical protein
MEPYTKLLSSERIVGDPQRNAETQFAGRLPEVAQTFDSISRIKFLVGCSRFGEPRFLGAV